MTRPGPTYLVLSLFPGIDMLGRGFDEEGFCVVRGPDLLWGGDIRRFHPPPRVFGGVIGGSPCQDFSRLRRDPPSGYGLEMLREFIRIVTESAATWFLLENVPGVPDICPPGYSVQRIDLNARECGMTQNRLRHYQFGHLLGHVITLNREAVAGHADHCVTAHDDRPFDRICALQGLPQDFDLPGFKQGAKTRAVGNGVPLPMARMVARAIRGARPPSGLRLCLCGCGREVTGDYGNAEERSVPKTNAATP